MLSCIIAWLACYTILCVLFLSWLGLFSTPLFQHYYSTTTRWHHIHTTNTRQPHRSQDAPQAKHQNNSNNRVQVNHTHNYHANFCRTIVRLKYLTTGQSAREIRQYIINVTVRPFKTSLEPAFRSNPTPPSKHQVCDFVFSLVTCKHSRHQLPRRETATVNTHSSG